MTNEERRVVLVNEIFNELWNRLVMQGLSINEGVQLAYQLVERFAEQLGEQNGKSLDENFVAVCQQISEWREVTLRILAESPLEKD